MKDKVLKGEKHFTASVWILNKSQPRKLILIHHKKFNMWMQPGGHIEKFENPVEAAVRETLEETGMNIDFLLKKIKVIYSDVSFLPVPEFLMEQNIPAYGDQPQHFHEDINYVVEVEEQELKLSERESHGIGWFTKEEILKMAINEDTKVVVEKLMQ